MDNGKMTKGYRVEKDSLGDVKVPSDCLWGAQTQRSLDHFSIGTDLMPRELVESYAILKKACAIVNQEEGSLDKDKSLIITEVCDEIIEGKHNLQFPLHVWSFFSSFARAIRSFSYFSIKEFIAS